MTLYEVTGQYLELMDMAEDDTVDPETLADTLEGVNAEMEDKAEGCAKIIRSLEADAAGLKTEEARLAAKRKTIENKIERLKDALEEAMIATNKTNFHTPLFTFRIQKNPPSFDFDDESKIPDEFWIQQDPKLDRKAALAYIKEHGDQDWGRIKQTESLRIK